jgi:ArsR family transcriptional regulator, arsenate/arsenite/antimonite-responsive transcriptional repressor
VSDATATCTCDGTGAASAPRALLPPLTDERLDAGLKALASAPRRQLLRIIATHTSVDGGCCDTEVCACKLADALELAPSTVSHHMSVLVRAGLVSATKRGLWVYYRLQRDALAALAAEFASL